MSDYSVTEQPYKIPYYASAVRLLYDMPAVGVEETSGLSLGRQTLDDFWKGFLGYSKYTTLASPSPTIIKWKALTYHR